MIFLGDLGVEGGEKLIETAGGKYGQPPYRWRTTVSTVLILTCTKNRRQSLPFGATPKWLWDNTPYLGGDAGKGQF